MVRRGYVIRQATDYSSGLALCWCMSSSFPSGFGIGNLNMQGGLGGFVGSLSCVESNVLGMSICCPNWNSILLVLQPRHKVVILPIIMQSTKQVSILVCRNVCVCVCVVDNKLAVHKALLDWNTNHFNFLWFGVHT